MKNPRKGSFCGLIVMVLIAGAISVGAAAFAAETNPAPAVPSDPFVKKTPAAPAPAWGYDYNLVITVQAYDLSLADGNALLQASDDDDVRYGKLRVLEKSGKAHLAVVMCGAVAPGEQMTISQLEIIRPPIWWEFSNGGASANPTDFKTRQLGYRLVCKPDDPKTNRVRYFFERTRLEGFLDQKLKGGAIMGRPQFGTSRSNRSVRMAPGHQEFLGTNTYEAEASNPTDPQMTLLFGKMEMVTVQPPQPVRPGSLEHEFSFYSLDPAKAVEILNRKPSTDSIYQAVQALVSTKEARLEHVIVGKGEQDENTDTDEATEHPYPTRPDAADSVTQDTGYIMHMTPKFVTGTSLEFLDLKTEWLRYLGEFGGRTIVTGHGSQPVFTATSADTRMNSALGEHELIGTFTPTVDAGVAGTPASDRIWLEFVQIKSLKP